MKESLSMKRDQIGSTVGLGELSQGRDVRDREVACERHELASRERELSLRGPQSLGERSKWSMRLAAERDSRAESSPAHRNSSGVDPVDACAGHCAEDESCASLSRHGRSIAVARLPRQ